MKALLCLVRGLVGILTGAGLCQETIPSEGVPLVPLISIDPSNNRMVSVVGPVKPPFKNLIAGVFLLSCSACQLLAQTWVQTSAPETNWTSVASSADGSNLVAAVSNGLIYLSTDGGGSWQPTSAPVGNWLAVCSSADGRTLAASANGVAYVSRNSGLTWEASGAGLSRLECSADGSKIFTIGGYQLFASADFGTNWKDLSVQAVPIGWDGFQSIASSADGGKSAVVDYAWGNVFVSTYYNLWAGWGTSVAGAIVGEGFAASVVSSADGNKLAAYVDTFAQSGGRLCASADAGSHWTVTVEPVTTFKAITSSADGTRLAAVATGDCIYMSTNSGANWNVVGAPLANWMSIASSADGNKLVAVVKGGGIYTSQMTPTPTLNITPSPGALLISWVVPSQQFVLQQNSRAANTGWTNVPISPVLSLTNLHKQVSIPTPAGMTFYRLASANPQK